jgi:hypothetical protein
MDALKSTGRGSMELNRSVKREEQSASKSNMSMNKDHQYQRSHLFTVRVWQEELGNDQSEWRGKVQHVHSGEAFYFREWQTLIAALTKMLSELENVEAQIETE